MTPTGSPIRTSRPGDPWVTAVGGTSLSIGSSNNRQFETGWGTAKWSLSGSSWVQTIPFQYGAGGGFSEIFAEPWYQDGIVGLEAEPDGRPGRPGHRDGCRSDDRHADR